VSKSRTQRYRLTHEFVLRDRGDYADIRASFQAAIARVHEFHTGTAPDYLAIERVYEPESKP
jgi:hypothetical protein